MKIILLKDVAKLGRKYDIKVVSDGYAINLLIPQGAAIAATPDAVKRIDAIREATEGERRVQEELLAKSIDDLKDAEVVIVGKANDKGHLFAGLHREAIAEEIQKQTRFVIDPSVIHLEHPIKEIGEHMVEIKAGNRSGKLKLVVKKQ